MKLLVKKKVFIIFDCNISLCCSALELIEHLRAMGETNALVNRVKVRILILHFVFNLVAIHLIFKSFARIALVLKKGHRFSNSSGL